MKIYVEKIAMCLSKTLFDHIEKWCNLTPDNLAILTPDEKLTYRQLNQYSDAVAEFLYTKNIGSGDIIPIEAVRSADFIIGLLGIMKTGAAYAPIDYIYPEQRKSYIIEQTRAAFILTSLPDSAIDKAKTGGRRVSIASLRRENAPKLNYRPQPNEPLYVIFTSGTTGVPKGVIVEHHSVEQIVSWHNKRFGINQSTRSTLIAALGFDVAQWEIWSPLSAGGRLYIFSGEIRRDVSLLVKALDELAITHAFVPTVMVHDVIEKSCPSPSSLEYLFTAGEKLNPVDTGHINYQLIDYYGPTEATIFTTCHFVPSSTQNLASSIGKPCGTAQIWILDEQRQKLPDGQAGEIFIAGSCLARGYLHNETLTNEKFLSHPFEEGERIYRTGDLGKILPDGSLQFLGRMDEQVKIRGHLVELGEIETLIARQFGVKKVSVITPNVVKNESKEAVAFIILDDEVKKESNIVNYIRQSISAFLPDYMMPSRYLIVESFPENSNGKIDKTALRELFDQHRSIAPDYDFSVIKDDSERAIFEIFAQTLGHTDFDNTQNFFDVGGHSLLAAKVIVLLSKHFELPLRITDLYNHSSVSELTNEIKDRLLSSGEISDYTSEESLRHDAILPDDIVFTGTFDQQRLKHAKHILLTGVTGLIGIHLLVELLGNTDADIHCIIRAKDAHDENGRLKEKLNQYKVIISALDLSRVKLYIGDISEPQLGMEQADYESLTMKIDVVYHSASAVNFIKPYKSMKKDNVDGMVALLRFAAAGRIKAMILLSTISVYSWGHWFTGKKTMREDDDIDQNLPAICADIGYVKSKWVMETLADQAKVRGMPLITFRLGYATYHSKTGISASYQWWGRLVKTCIALGVVPDIVELHEGLSTIDYMSKSIAYISKKPSALGQKFNLIHSKEKNLSLQEFFIQLEKDFGYKFKTLPFYEWRALWEFDSNAPLYPVLNLFKDPMYEGKCLIELYQHTYIWGRENTQMFLEGSDIKQPEFDKAELQLYIQQSIDALPAWRREY